MTAKHELVKVEVKEGDWSEMVGKCYHGFLQRVMLTGDVSGQPTIGSQKNAEEHLEAAHNLFHTYENKVPCDGLQLEIVTTVRTPVK